MLASDFSVPETERQNEATFRFLLPHIFHKGTETVAGKWQFAGTCSHSNSFVFLHGKAALLSLLNEYFNYDFIVLMK